MFTDPVENGSEPQELTSGSEEHLLASGEDGRPIQDVALGLALYSAGAAWNSMNNALRLAGSLGGLIFSPVKRVFHTETLEPVRSGFEKLVTRGETEMDDWIQTGLSQKPRAREAAEKVMDPLVEAVVSYLSTNPSVQKLIKDQIDQLAKESKDLPQINVLVRVLADNYITYLNENPDQVKQLIRDQADEYIDHLAENPEQVQTLVQGQSLSMAGEITDEVRERTVTADSALEALARRLFRRRPRTELPEPPPEVQARALQARQPQDFPRLEAMNNGEE